MTSPRENRPAVLAAVLAQALPGAAPARIAEAVTAMTAAAKAHKRAAEYACSYPTDEAWRERTTRRLIRLACDAERPLIDGDAGRHFIGPGVIRVMLATEPGACRHIRLKFGGDPRGPCGVLFISDRDGDSFDEHNGRRGWAIYE